MQNFANFLGNVFAFFKTLPPWLPLLIIWSIFGALSVAVLILCLCNKSVKSHDKNPFLHLLNAFTALTLAFSATEGDTPRAIAISATFWLLGYLFYGLLCALTPKSERQNCKEGCFYAPYSSFQSANSNAEREQVPVPTQRAFSSGTATIENGAIRLEHAISITDKLLQKNLGKGDRQELERMKGVLYSMQLKSAFSIDDGKILNGHFNSLLKLMAKYNL